MIPAMTNRQCVVPRGKVIGGSSSINGVMYVRGNCKDYDHWAALGNRGWSCKDVLPYFKKSENSQVEGDKNYHGIGGFWNIEYGLPSSPLFDNFVNGSLERKQSFGDYNGENQTGSAKFQTNTKRGRRQSLGTAFLNNARKRSNLKVVTKALVTKITTDQRSKQATGVEFVTQNRKFLVRARQEVIISAGAINTPQLLMLSGIGPREHLTEMKIPLIADLPVGQNLIEHPLLNLIFRTNYTEPNATLENLVERYLNGLGPLTKGGSADGTGFIHTKNNSQVPSIQIAFAPPNAIDPSISRRSLNYNNTISETFLKNIKPESDILIYVMLLHEKERSNFTKLKQPD